MAHEIDQSNNRNNIAYIGKAPWHKLGQKLTPDADMQTWCIEAGLDWDACRAEAKFDDDGNSYIVEGRDVLFRSDTKKPLGIVGTRYNVVQPSAALSLYQKLTESYGATMEVAGSLQGGKIIWCLAKSGDSFSIKGDEVHEYILFTTSYTGMSSTVAKHTSVRVVCNNTLDVALAGNSNTIRIPHSRVFSQDAVISRLTDMKKDWSSFKDEVTELSKKSVSDAEAATWLVSVFGDTTLPIEAQPNAIQMKRALQLYRGRGIGSQMPSAAGTAWGLVNAVTQLVDHNAHARSADTRLYNAWMGDGVLLKRRAYSAALRMVA